MSKTHTLSDEDVKHVAALSNLTLTDTEITKYKKQLSDIVGHIAELSEVDTDAVEPTSQTTGLENVTRIDSEKDIASLPQDAATAQAKKAHNGYFVVPMILEERTV